MKKESREELRKSIEEFEKCSAYDADRKYRDYERLADPTAVLSLLALLDKYEEAIATSAVVRDGCCWCVECGKMETRGCVVRPCGFHESKEHCEHQIAREALKGVG